MSTCILFGHDDMYGLGIRLGFYFLWAGTVLACRIAPGEVAWMRLTNSFFSTASFLSMITQTRSNNLRPVEIYIVLMLSFGGFLYYIPLYIGRLFTIFSTRWNPNCFYRKGTEGKSNNLNFILLVSISSFSLRFWYAKVEAIDPEDCYYYGFFFTKVLLSQMRHRVANIMFHSSWLSFCLWILCLRIIKAFSDHSANKERRLRKRRALLVLRLHTFANLLLISVVIASIELTLKWNNIKHVNKASSSCQIIPIIISLGLILRSIFSFVLPGVKHNKTKRTLTKKFNRSISNSRAHPSPFSSQPLRSHPHNAYINLDLENAQLPLSRPEKVHQCMPSHFPGRPQPPYPLD